jgi:hypothetical protein
MHINFKVIKFISLDVALHVFDTNVSIIRSFPLLHMQPLVTVWCFVHHQELLSTAHAASGHRVL